MLFDGGRAAILKAKLHFENNQIAQRGEAISKAIDIVETGLKLSVSKEKGGEIADQLIIAYDLIVYHLTQANLHADPKRLDIAEQMLTTLSDTWKEATQK